jgi:dihydrolipoamide dehydrogenase
MGSGPGGYVAAIRAAQLGLKTAVVEKDKVGGVCLNVGCIPSKSLIHQAEIFSSAGALASMGVGVDTAGLDYSKVHRKSRLAAERLSKGVEYLLKKNKIELVKGTARIASPGTVEVSEDQKLTAKNILIATGSRPRALPGFEFDEQKILSSTGALMLQKVPKSMLIIGAGAIGVEFAHIFSSFGTEIHLVEMLDQIVPLEDPEAASTLHKAFSKRGMDVHVNTKAKSYKEEDGTMVVEMEDSSGKAGRVTVDCMVVAVGRSPNSEELGLEALGVELEKGFIKTGDYYQTNVPGIYAIGDVINSPLLAHVASKEGEIAVEHMAGKNPETRMDLNAFPGAVYCEPEIGSFGLNERSAKEKGIKFETSVFPYRGCGKAVATEKAEGFVKVLFDPGSREILGATIVGAQATELIHEVLLARHSELLPEDIATMVHAHPTLSESVMEAMRGAEGWAIHV